MLFVSTKISCVFIIIFSDAFTIFLRARNFYCILVFAFSLNAYAQSVNKDVPSISVRFMLSGDLIENYQFAGPFGSKLSGEAETANPKCTYSAIFRSVRRQNKTQIEVNSILECPVNQQINTFRPPTFFIEEKAAANAVIFSFLSAEYKKIQVIISDLKISKKQAK